MYYVFCEKCNIWTTRNTPISALDYFRDNKEKLEAWDEFELCFCNNCDVLNYYVYEVEGDHVNCWKCYRKTNRRCGHDFCNDCDKSSSIIHLTRNSICIDCWKCCLCKSSYNMTKMEIDDFAKHAQTLLVKIFIKNNLLWE